MKEYPSIPREIQRGMSVYAFDKIDGSNIRAEWSKKAGFYKFGSRTRLLGSDQGVLQKAEDMIRDGFSEPVTKIAKKQGWDRLILFFEFAGPQSFAGDHVEEDVHDVWLIDANPYKKGILPPKEFLSFFGDLHIAPCLYHGPCDGDFVTSVRNSTLEGMTEEGVVCKAKTPKKTPAPVMFKIKSQRWLDRLKEHCQGDERLYQLLL
jgi:hypothetical protein